MNERTEELAKQAAEYAIEFATQDQEQYIPKLMEKFAELIVAECLDTIMSCECIERPDIDEEFIKGYNQGVGLAARQVELHFGVEE